MQKRLFTFLLLGIISFGLNAQNTNLTNLISANDWSSIFPNRAGIKGSHPQGYTNDFYSYNNFKQAISEMADFTVSIRKKANIAGQITTVSKRSTGTSYQLSSIPTYWGSHSGAESVITVDFAKFINEASQYNNKRELAAFLANISKETTGGWQNVGSNGTGDHSKWGLYYVKELNSTNCYKQTDANYPAKSGKCYYGRGPIQISWNYNYGQCSHFIYGDKNVLLNNPDAVEQDGVLAFKTAIWFWMNPQCPKPSCHQVMHDLWQPAQGDYSKAKMNSKGFAHTNNIINGGLECRANTSSNFKSKVVLRSNLYQHYLKSLGFTTSQLNQENSNGYSTTCYETPSKAMSNYAACDVVGTTAACKEPSLGADQTICGETITLNANVTLEIGESIKWYQNGNLISGASAASFSTNEAGDYKAELSSTNCIRTDEVKLNPGGDVSVTASRGGTFCANNSIPSVTLNGVGGGGFYNFYDKANSGSIIGSGASLIIDEKMVSKGTSKTFYVEAPAGETSTIGLDNKLSSNSNWANITNDLGWNKINTVFTTQSNVTLQSIDFILGYINDNTEHSLNIKIYEFGTTKLVASKSFLFSGDDVDWNGPMNTIPLDISLEPGQYELSTIESKILIWQTSNDSKNPLGWDSWNTTGIASLDGEVSPDNRDWGVYKNNNQGTFNWKFSTGSSSSCGRVPVTVTHEDCGGNNVDTNSTNGIEDIIAKTIAVYPSPASEEINVSFKTNSNNEISISIFNSVGVLLESVSTSTNDESHLINFDTKNMSAGLYFITLNSSKTALTKPITIVK